MAVQTDFQTKALAFGIEIQQSRSNYLHVRGGSDGLNSSCLDGVICGYCWGRSWSSGNNDGKGCLVKAAIAVIFAAIIALVFSFSSALEATGCREKKLHAEAKCNELAGDHVSPQARIYQSSVIILSERTTERYLTALSQLAMGSGLGMLTVAFIVAYAINITPPGYAMDMIYYGGGITAAGIIGYGVVQIRYTSTQHKNIKNAYDDLNQAVSALQRIPVAEAVGNPPGYNEVNHEV